MRRTFKDRVGRCDRCDDWKDHPEKSSQDCAVRSLAHVLASIDGRSCGAGDDIYYTVALETYRQHTWWDEEWVPGRSGAQNWQIEKAMETWGAQNNLWILKTHENIQLYRMYSDRRYLPTHNQVIRRVGEVFPDVGTVVLESATHIWCLTRNGKGADAGSSDWTSHDWTPGSQTRIERIWLLV